MARTIKVIQQKIIDEIQRDAVLSTQLTSTSSTAIWRLFTYVFAVSIWVLESLFDTHKAEVNTTIEKIIPGRPKWYRDKALAFMVDKTLPIDTALKIDSDVYDTTGMTEEQITAAKVITYATAAEENGSSVLVVKIATGVAGSLLPASSEVENQFAAYMEQIRYAGVKLSIVNLAGDDFFTELDIYYSALLVSSDVEIAVKEAIKGYITGLDFNGEYTNMAMVDAIQKVDGVKVVEFKSAKTNNAYINGKVTPLAGYFTYVEDNITLNLQPYQANQ